MEIIDQLDTFNITENIALHVGNQGAPRYGCWIDSPTAVGDMRIGGKDWYTYTRPIFAYLENRQFSQLPSGGKNGIKTTYTQGFTEETKLSLGVDFSIPGLGNLNLTLGLSLGYEAKWTSSESTSVEKTIEIAGEGTFQLYNLILVYAHCATSAGRENSKLKPSRKKIYPDGSIDLTFLTAVGTEHHVYAQNDKILKENFTFGRVQQEILDRYNAFENKGPFTFDFGTKITF
ncbi:hypothetical protein D3C76_297220 [compost metagenome]